LRFPLPHSLIIGRGRVAAADGFLCVRRERDQSIEPRTPNSKEPNPPMKKRNPLTLAAALDRFVLQLEADGRSAHTIAQYRRHVRLLARWARTACVLDDVARIRHEDLARFLASAAARTRPDGHSKKETAVNALRSSLRVFFGFATRAGYAHSDPSHLIRRAICSPGPPRALPEDDARKLLATVARDRSPEARRDHALFALMLGAGLRLGSALGLDVPDIDVVRSEIVVRRLKRNREDRFFVPRREMALLRALVRGRTSGPVFLTAAGRRLSARHAQRRLAEWFVRAGVERHASPHALRHAFAMRLYRRTGDLLLVKHALGQRSIASTLVYARSSDQAVRTALEAI